MSVFKKKKDLKIDLDESLLRLAGVRGYSRPGLDDCDEGALTEEEIDHLEDEALREAEAFEKMLLSEESRRLAGASKRYEYYGFDEDDGLDEEEKDLQEALDEIALEAPESDLEDDMTEAYASPTKSLEAFMAALRASKPTDNNKAELSDLLRKHIMALHDGMTSGARGWIGGPLKTAASELIKQTSDLRKKKK